MMSIYVLLFLIKKKTIIINFHFIAETIEKYASITCGCVINKVSLNFFSEFLATLVRILKERELIRERKVFGDMWQLVKQKMADTFAAFKKPSDYDKPTTNKGKLFPSLTGLQC